MNKRFVAAGLGLLVMGSLAASAWKDPFEGKWKIDAQPESNGKEFKDTLTFKGMKMTAADLERKGWAPADYDDDVRQGGIAQFNCTLKNAKAEEEMKWQGSITAADMRGTIVWTHKDKSEDRYNFTGSKN